MKRKCVCVCVCVCVCPSVSRENMFVTLRDLWDLSVDSIRIHAGAHVNHLFERMFSFLYKNLYRVLVVIISSDCHMMSVGKH
jgi:hypothetical protein